MTTNADGTRRWKPEEIDAAIDEILAKDESPHTDGLPVVNDKKFEAESRWLCNGYDLSSARPALLDTSKGRLLCGFITAACIAVLLVLFFAL